MTTRKQKRLQWMRVAYPKVYAAHMAELSGMPLPVDRPMTTEEFGNWIVDIYHAWNAGELSIVLKS